VILELHRATEIDSTGVHVLSEIDSDLARRAVTLTLVLRDNSEIATRLAELPSRRFPDVDPRN